MTQQSMQRRLVVIVLSTFVLVAACQPIQPIEDKAVLAPMSTPDLVGMQTESWSSTAPDGQWVAEGLVAFPAAGEDQYYTELRVKKVEESVEWTPVAGWSNFGLGYTTPRPMHWSPDGRYLYFTNAPVPDGCALFTNASDLQRLDLSDGSVSELLSPNLTNALAFAPDGSTVALSRKSELYLLDPATANYAAFSVQTLETGAQWGSIVWSPDSQKVAFTIAYAPCQPPAWSQSIVVMDIATLTMTTVLEKEPRRLTSSAWLDAGQILLTDYEGKQWVLDLTTGEVSAVAQ